MKVVITFNRKNEHVVNIPCFNDEEHRAYYEDEKNKRYPPGYVVKQIDYKLKNPVIAEYTF